MNILRNESFKLTLLCSLVVLVVLLSYNVLIAPPVTAGPLTTGLTPAVDESSVYAQLLEQIQQLQSKINDVVQREPGEIRQNLVEPAATVKQDIVPEKPSTSSALSLSEKASLFDQGKCTIDDKIYFLKTSKTGSTSVANILMRFGLRRPGTTFLVGETANGGFFFHNEYMPFNAETCYLGKTVEPRPVFDISYVHMRYNKTAIDYLMHPDHKKITILRDPITNFISSWRYYRGFNNKLRASLPMYTGTNKTKTFDPKDKEPDVYSEIEQFLERPQHYLENVDFHHGPQLFLYHPQFIFFGYPTYLIKFTEKRKVEKLVNTWLNEIERDFDHILIMERMEESLAMMMIKFCWTLDDVANLKLNSANYQAPKLTEAAMASLKKLNWADFDLYGMMLKRFEREKAQIGAERVERLARQIEAKNAELVAECTKNVQSVNFQLSPESKKNQTCTMALRDQTTNIQYEQLLRWKASDPSFTSDKSSSPLKTSTGEIRQGTKMPNLCGPVNFKQHLQDKQQNVYEFFSFATNEHDIRPEWPSHVTEFVSKTQELRLKDADFIQIWN